MRWSAPKWPSLARLLVVLLIMLDTLRHILGPDTRPVDEWMLVIEVLVLFLIFVDLTGRITAWCMGWWKRKRYKVKMKRWLDSLGQAEAEALENLVLLRTEPAPNLTASLRAAMPSAFDNDYKGTCVTPDHKVFIQQWAEHRKHERKKS